MSINLVDLIGQELGGSVGQKIAGVIGASPQSAASGLGAAVPAVLGGLLQKATSGTGASDLVGLLSGGNFDSIVSNLSGALGGGDATKSLLDKGQSVITSLFGNKAAAVGNYVSNNSGLTGAASTSLLAMAGPMVLGFITRHLRGVGGLNIDGVKNFLASQAGHLKSAPAGLAGALGVANLSDLGGAVASMAPRAAAPTSAPIPTPPSVEPSGGGMGWLPWVLLGLALVAAFALLKGCHHDEAPAPVVATPPAAVPAPAAPVVAADGLVDRKLADGTVIRIKPNGVEDQLLAFIEDSSKVVDKETWFSFDRLEFDTGKATLKPESGAQLDNMAAILKAYPNVNLKIGGYTDNTGNKDANLKLSKDRAEAAMKGIVDRGIVADRLAAEGYGEDHPVADNATEEGRAKNRRIDVRVTKK